MRGFRDLPIRRKLMIVVALTTAVASVTANAVLLGIDAARFRAHLEQEIASLARLVAEGEEAPLSFRDAKAAQSALDALAALPEIVSAAVFTTDGSKLATYPRGSDSALAPPAFRFSTLFADGGLTVVQPVTVAGKVAGAVVLRSDLRRLHRRLRTQALTTAGVVAFAVGLALLVSTFLQRTITRPLLELAGTADKVAQRGDYGLRARRYGADELGRLVDAFNGILAQIAARDAELQRARDELESRVADRTAELALRNEELARSNRDLDDFAYIASHDLKEPLRGIHNYATFLLEDCGAILDEDALAKLRTLTRLTRRMDALIDALLYYSRVGRLDLAIRDVDLDEAVSEVIDSLHISLEEYGVEVRIPRRLPVIRCDEARIGEVYRNLIVNAMKFNDKPTRWIELGALSPEEAARSQGRPALPPDTQAVLYVKDNGIGIPERHYESIFRIFKRLHAREQYGGGNGAGLTIVKKIIERHNGEVWVESSVGEGTTFFIAL